MIYQSILYSTHCVDGIEVCSRLQKHFESIGSPIIIENLQKGTLGFCILQFVQTVYTQYVIFQVCVTIIPELKG